MVGAGIMGFLFIMKVYSMRDVSVDRFTHSKFAYILFKADWVNVHMVGFAKIVGIYFINYAGDLKVLFICLTIFYGLLLFVCSDFLIDKMFNIQQGVFTIAKGLDNWFVGSLDGDTPAR